MTDMTRIAKAFAAASDANRPALVAYIMSGDPDNEHAFQYARAILAECDILEIGIPFSEPVADGPTIERAAVRALAQGHRMQHALDLAERLSAESDKPLVFMTYYNPVVQRGLERFAKECHDAGIDGIILPDVPLEESADAFAALDAHGIALIQLASPATPAARFTRLAEKTRGFLYVVSSFGVTGARTEFAPETLDLVARAKKACAGRVPIAVGFGVSEPRHARALHQAGADGVVVGSAIVGRIEKRETPETVAAYVRTLRDA